LVIIKEILATFIIYYHKNISFASFFSMAHNNY